MRLRSLGAETTAWLLSVDGQAGGWVAGAFDAAFSEPDAGPRNAPSVAAAEAGSFSAHSQTTWQAQPADESAVSEASSRARLRAILARQ